MTMEVAAHIGGSGAGDRLLVDAAEGVVQWEGRPDVEELIGGGPAW
jgi:hypothetical protein